MASVTTLSGSDAAGLDGEILEVWAEVFGPVD